MLFLETKVLPKIECGCVQSYDLQKLMFCLFKKIRKKSRAFMNRIPSNLNRVSKPNQAVKPMNDVTQLKFDDFRILYMDVKHENLLTDQTHCKIEQHLSRTIRQQKIIVFEQQNTI